MNCVVPQDRAVLVGTMAACTGDRSDHKADPKGPKDSATPKEESESDGRIGAVPGHRSRQFEGSTSGFRLWDSSVWPRDDPCRGTASSPSSRISLPCDSVSKHKSNNKAYFKGTSLNLYTTNLYSGTGYV